VRRPHARDRYGRLLAVCYVGGESINERIVREGWALDFRKYSTDYLQAEAEARRTGAGIWCGEFEPPWEWRASARSAQRP
jgi:endonuclease YncB( thermonuclease family)